MATQPQIYRVCVIYMPNDHFETKLEYSVQILKTKCVCAVPLYTLTYTPINMLEKGIGHEPMDSGQSSMCSNQ